jgi:hypothetical protein
MKKHTLIILGLLFLTQWVQAQETDSLMKTLAVEKMKVFAGLLRYIATPGLDLATKAQVQRAIEGDFLDKGEAFFYNDINNHFGNTSPQVEASTYFSQLKALYPNGANLLSSNYQFSDIFYNEARDMYYMVFRCERHFSGLNALAKKDITISKTIDYQINLLEKGQLSLSIVVGREADGALNVPMGHDKNLNELPNKKPQIIGSTVPAELKIEEGKKLLQFAKEMSNRYEEIMELADGREETPEERKQRKQQVKAEKARLAREIKKAKQERNSLTTKKINIRIGFGYFVSDTMVNNIPGRIEQQTFKSWVAKMDIQYKFTGVTRRPNGEWQKAHTVGLFMNYGKQSGSNIKNMASHGRQFEGLDTTRPGKGFFEAEVGVMLREEFRLSGGMGMMNYHKMQDGIFSNGSNSYYSFTAGLSPRLMKFVEMDFNVSGVYINGAFRPRANMNLVLLLKAKRK